MAVKVYWTPENVKANKIKSTSFNTADLNHTAFEKGVTILKDTHQNVLAIIPNSQYISVEKSPF